MALFLFLLQHVACRIVQIGVKAGHTVCRMIT